MPTGMLLPATAITAIASVLIARRCHRQKVNANADATAKKEKVHELCVLVEICCDTVQSVTAAVLNGADRVELCANLVDGGTTPSPGLIRSAVRIAKKCSSHSSECRVNVLIRPRGGDFVYTAEELSVMEEDIRFCKRAGCNGVVLGVLDRQGGVDVQVTRALVEAARPMQVTFHRAIDMAADPVSAVHDVVRSGCDKILTSGGASTVLEGAATVRAMIRCAQGRRIDFIAASGVSEDNVLAILKACGPGCREVHGSLRSPIESSMVFRKTGVWMGGSKVNGATTEFVNKHASPERIQALREVLSRTVDLDRV